MVQIKGYKNKPKFSKTAHVKIFQKKNFYI